MDIDFECRLWLKASQVFGNWLQSLVEEGIDSYKRQPGLDDPARMHRSQIGAAAFDALQGALEARDMLEDDWSHDAFLVIRSHLRLHLRRHLEQQIMLALGTADEFSENHLSTDLGL